MRIARTCAQKALLPLRYGTRFTINNRRAFHTSRCLAVIRPFLLSDIGEGGNTVSRCWEVGIMLMDE